jgi:serine/threonine protein kinase
MSTVKFGRYEIKGELGRGGMASVYHANDPRFERDVAIKVLPREFLHDPQFRARFEREAKTIAMLEHPAIVPVYDFGEEEGQPYIVMRYMSGGSMTERINKGPMQLDEIVKTISRLAPALDAAHAKGIIHRDLKPGNVLYDQYGNAFLSDFGIARLTQSSTVTLTGGAILGTPAYMSPEQVSGGGTIDGRSDIYAMGVILYQMLTGKTPYQADTAAKLMMMHILEPVPRVLDEKDDLPAEFDAVIEKAMAKSPDERFQTTEEMATAIDLASRGIQDTTRLGKKTEVKAGEATRFKPSATVMAPLTRRPEKAAPAIPAAASVPESVPQKKSGMSIIAIGGIVLILLLIIGGVGAGAIFLGTRNKGDQQPTATIGLIAAITQATATQEVTVTPIPPSETPIPTPTFTMAPSDTPLPTDTATEVPPTPTETPTSIPALPSLGGVDKIAFIRSNDVWVVNLDGTGLDQLTTDGGIKTELQWTPDGTAVVYIQGLCAKIVYFETKRVDNIICFQLAGTQLDEFEISPDGSHVAISIFSELYIIPFDLEQLQASDRLSDIQAMADCNAMGPYASSTGTPIAVFQAIWSQDMKQMSVLQKIIYHGIQEDAVALLDISNCNSDRPDKIIEIPGDWYRLTGDVTTLENFGWDGFNMFALEKEVRNGYGDLTFFNSATYQPLNEKNPIDNSCCYRDPIYSPDGTYLAFAYQEYSLDNIIQLYYIPAGTLFTGLTYTPIPLPDGFFTNPKEKPQPALRPAIPAP